MKCVIVAVFALVVAVNAKPYDIGVPGIGLGLGLSTQFQQANQFANTGFNQGSHGFGAQGFQAGGALNSYDKGTEESSFSTMSQGHKSSSHDRGTNQVYGIGAGSVGGYDQHAMGFANQGAAMAAGATHLG